MSELNATTYTKAPSYVVFRLVISHSAKHTSDFSSVNFHSSSSTYKTAFPGAFI